MKKIDKFFSILYKI